MSHERNVHSIQSRHQNEMFYRKIAFGLLLCLIAFTLPSLCRSHQHESPSFKYSREANEHFQTVQHNHDHGHAGFSDEHRHSHHHHDDDDSHPHSHLHEHHSTKRETFVQGKRRKH